MARGCGIVMGLPVSVSSQPVEAMQSKRNKIENICINKANEKEKRYREVGMIYLFERGEELGVKRR